MPDHPLLTIQDEQDYQRQLGILHAEAEHAARFLSAVYEIHSRRLYLASYATWEDFCREQMGRTARHVYRLLEAFKVAPGLPERQARELAKLPEADRPAALQRAQESTGGPPTAAAIAQAAETPEAVDALGQAVEERWAATFREARRFHAAIHAAGTLKALVEACLETKAGLVLAEHKLQIERDRRNIVNALAFSKPHAVCPYCGGAGRPDCGGCKGRGWVTKLIWEQSPAHVPAQR